MTETLKTIATNRLIDGDKLAAIKTDGTGTTLFLSDDGTYKAPPGSTGPGTGDVVGPASAVDSNFAAFNTTTGKLIKDSGSKASDFATAAQGAKADTAVQPAGLSGYELLANKDTDGTLAANSDTKYPSQKAVKTYADTKQPVCEEQTTSFTAAVHGNYIITGTATVTDPTPEAGHGFTCLVRNGTATVGGTAYAIVGTRIERTYHSGAWANAVWLPIASPGTATQVLTSNGASSAPTFQDAAAGGSAYEFTAQSYEGPAVVGILGKFDATTAKTLAEVTIISDTLPVGSSLICELRKNSTSSGNILSSTLQVTTTESATNGRYVGTTVTSFTSASIADGDVLYATLTGVGSTTPATNARVILRFSA